MYILKNALLNICQSKIRNLIISLIIIAISTVCCMSLSLFQSANKATNDALRDSSVIARVIKGDVLGSIDASEPLSYGEIIEFSRSKYVYDTYIEYKSEIDLIGSPFTHTAIGYSSGVAAKYFRQVEKLISKGVMFDPWSSTRECVISSTLSNMLEISIGNTIVIAQRNSEDVHEFVVTGFFSGNALTVNDVLMGFNVLEEIINLDNQTPINSAFSINHPDNIEPFREYVSQSNIGGNTYKAFFSGIKKFKDTFYPIESTKNIAFLALIVSLILGCSILVVISIFNVNERKYEVGVLSAMGMSKKKIITQFVSEMLIVTIVSVVIGILIAIPLSVMSTRSLLSPKLYTNMSYSLRNQVSLQGRLPRRLSEEEAREAIAEHANSEGGGTRTAGTINIGYRADDTADADLGVIMSKTTNILNTAKAVVSLEIVFCLIGIGLFLALISSFASIIFIVRFDSIKLLGERLS